MKDFKEAYRALAPLRERPLPVAEAHPEARARTVGRMKDLLQTVPEPARWSKAKLGVAVGVVASAAVAAALVVTWSRPSTTPNAVLELSPQGKVTVAFAQEHTNVEVLTRTQVPARGRLSTSADSTVNIVTPSGLRVAVGQNSELGLSELADAKDGVLRLTRGTVECQVPKQTPGGSFSVVTPDATIVVRGTIFSVELGQRNVDHQTCVRVSEGLVSVQRSRSFEQLRGGESSGCEPAAPSVAATNPETIGTDAPDLPRASARRDDKAAPAPMAGSLAAESALLRQALLAEQRGDIAKARRSLDSLLGRYPQSALANEARRVRARLGTGQAP